MEATAVQASGRPIQVSGRDVTLENSGGAEDAQASSLPGSGSEQFSPRNNYVASVIQGGPGAD